MVADVTGHGHHTTQTFSRVNSTHSLSLVISRNRGRGCAEGEGGAVQVRCFIRDYVPRCPQCSFWLVV